MAKRLNDNIAIVTADELQTINVDGMGNLFLISGTSGEDYFIFNAETQKKYSIDRDLYPPDSPEVSNQFTQAILSVDGKSCALMSVMNKGRNFSSYSVTPIIHCPSGGPIYDFEPVPETDPGVAYALTLNWSVFSSFRFDNDSLTVTGKLQNSGSFDIQLPSAPIIYQYDNVSPPPEEEGRTIYPWGYIEDFRSLSGFFNTYLNKSGDEYILKFVSNWTSSYIDQSELYLVVDRISETPLRYVCSAWPSFQYRSGSLNGMIGVDVWNERIDFISTNNPVEVVNTAPYNLNAPGYLFSGTLFRGSGSYTFFISSEYSQTYKYDFTQNYSFPNDIVTETLEIYKSTYDSGSGRVEIFSEGPPSFFTRDFPLYDQDLDEIQEELGGYHIFISSSNPPILVYPNTVVTLSNKFNSEDGSFRYKSLKFQIYLKDGKKSIKLIKSSKPFVLEGALRGVAVR